MFGYGTDCGWGEAWEETVTLGVLCSNFLPVDHSIFGEAPKTISSKAKLTIRHRKYTIYFRKFLKLTRHTKLWFAKVIQAIKTTEKYPGMSQTPRRDIPKSAELPKGFAMVSWFLALGELSLPQG